MAKATKKAAIIEGKAKASTAKVNLNAVSTDSAIIVKMIDNVKKISTSAKTAISITAASCVMHAIKNGDITLGRSLLDTLSASEGDKRGATPWRTNALRDWFVKEGPFSVKEKEDGKKGKELVYDDKKAKHLAKIMNADEARFGSALVRNPFWLAKPEPEYQGFDFDTEFARLMAKAKKASEITDADKKAKVKLGAYNAVLAAKGRGWDAATVH